MTVHGAKGLEADIVILPDTTTIPEGSGRHGALLYTDNALVFPVPDAQAPTWCARRRRKPTRTRCTNIAGSSMSR